MVFCAFLLHLERQEDFNAPYFSLQMCAALRVSLDDLVRSLSDTIAVSSTASDRTESEPQSNVTNMCFCSNQPQNHFPVVLPLPKPETLHITVASSTTQLIEREYRHEYLAVIGEAVRSTRCSPTSHPNIFDRFKGVTLEIDSFSSSSNDRTSNGEKLVKLSRVQVTLLKQGPSSASLPQLSTMFVASPIVVCMSKQRQSGHAPEQMSRSSCWIVVVPNSLSSTL